MEAREDADPRPSSAARRPVLILWEPLRSADEAIEAKQADVVACLAVDGEVGGDLAEHAAELESMPRAASDADDLRRVGMEADDEVLVRRHLEETGAKR